MVMSGLKILQLCHGKIIPDYVSAYSMRVNHLLEGKSRFICSVGGLILHDQTMNNAHEYRSLMTTAYSLMKGGRFLEIAISKGFLLRKKYINMVKSQIHTADIVIFEGPWQYPLFQECLDKKFVVYDAHNVEALLREGDKYHDYAMNIENGLASRSDLILPVEENDLNYFKGKFNHKNLILATHILGNKAYPWAGKNSNHIIFIGSIYKPNVEAVEIIVSLAKTLPEFQFEIVGNVNTRSFPHAPKNVVFHGLVEEDRKNELFKKCFVAVNPVISGGGRNVKMVDYIMHGMPIISTETGIRGLRNYNIHDSIIVEGIGNFRNAILKLADNRELLKTMADNICRLRDEILRAEGAIDIYEKIKAEFDEWKSRQGT
jgi:glycosyltransferase involved in cell wall biosynthesis